MIKTYKQEFVAADKYSPLMRAAYRVGDRPRVLMADNTLHIWTTAGMYIIPEDAQFAEELDPWCWGSEMCRLNDEEFDPAYDRLVKVLMYSKALNLDEFMSGEGFAVMAAGGEYNAQFYGPTNLMPAILLDNVTEGSWFKLNFPMVAQSRNRYDWREDIPVILHLRVKAQQDGFHKFSQFGKFEDVLDYVLG